MANIHKANIYNDHGIVTAWHLVRYNKAAVQEAIDRDPTIGQKEAKAIHALLKGSKGFGG